MNAIISNLSLNKRKLRKKIQICNAYIAKCKLQKESLLFDKVIKYNQDLLLYLEQIINNQSGFFNQVADFLIYQPMEFIADHKLLTIGGIGCIAALTAVGTYFIKYRSSPQTTHSTILPEEFYEYGKITLTKGNITKQSFKDNENAAIVNAAKPNLLGGAGIDGAIHSAAGPKLKEECENLTSANRIRCPVGQARITKGHNLAPLKIIHTVGPNTNIPNQNANKEHLLTSAYQNSLLVAIQNSIKHVALPAISTGIYGYDKKEKYF